MNKDRLVALGIEDRHRLRKRRFIEKIRRGSVAPLPAKTNLGCCAVFLGFPLTNTPSPNAQQLKRNQPLSQHLPMQVEIIMGAFSPLFNRYSKLLSIFGLFCCLSRCTRRISGVSLASDIYRSRDYSKDPKMNISSDSSPLV